MSRVGNNKVPVSTSSAVDTFFKRLFTNGTEKSSHSTPGPANGETAAIKDVLGSLSITPSPHTRPLLSKPMPRDESALTRFGGAKKRKITDSEKIKASEINQDVPKPSHPTLHAAQTPGDNPNGQEINHKVISRPVAQAGAPREQETATLPVPGSDRYIQEWAYYSKCYSQGRFNISNPPDPPPHAAEFTFLTAPTPPDEVGRLQAYRKTSFDLPEYAQEAAQHLVALAVRVFQVRHAALSFFGQHDEIMRAESGYNKRFISRGISIGAHALLSGGEPMIVLDTQKDWRFRAHPLVRGPPYIRFYVAVPLKSPDGHTLGVLAVFDPLPRTEFSPKHRRMLGGFTKIAITDLQMVMEAQDAKAAAAHTKAGPKSTYNGSRITKALTIYEDAELEEALKEISLALSVAAAEVQANAPDTQRLPALRPSTDTSQQSEVPKVPPKSPKRLLRPRTHTVVRIDEGNEVNMKHPLSIKTQDSSITMVPTADEFAMPTPPDTPLSTTSSPTAPCGLDKELPSLPLPDRNIHPALRISPVKTSEGPRGRFGSAQSSSPSSGLSRKFSNEVIRHDASSRVPSGSIVSPTKRGKNPELAHGLSSVFSDEVSSPTKPVKTSGDSRGAFQISAAQRRPPGHHGPPPEFSLPRMPLVRSSGESHSRHRPLESGPRPMASLQSLRPRRLPNSLGSETVAQIQYILGLVSRRIRHELVYILRVQPFEGSQRNPFGRRALQWSTNVLAAYGMIEPPPPCSVHVHLRVLRAGTGMVYTNRRAETAQEGMRYRSGFLVIVDRDPDLRQGAGNSARPPTAVQVMDRLARPAPHCNGGIVLAAFSKDEASEDDLTTKLLSLLSSGSIMLRETLARDGLC